MGVVEEGSSGRVDVEVTDSLDVWTQDCRGDTMIYIDHFLNLNVI